MTKKEAAEALAKIAEPACSLANDLRLTPEMISFFNGLISGCNFGYNAINAITMEEKE